ncbi:hypothetical protein PF005_g15953 [Phytophthora fragariae]|uniref:Uncharacterized protein n=1 Tax=Phytophthora fragariae TaxID=53985 RepID=A0A6A3XH08_9STRA|nr:hypothetical protein PF011_g18221 [Phytophthora fragariae]KAE9089857.1 hypothetical protein PF007_g19457 [Phytophthora fragariae]KAE9098377.1 hypothetical protein PF010_g15585 [Phytophthora fragariae]KAE9134088.1 hypothetical protein PF006_g14899 [Phytophthora fragariae]KAE9198918.1 hypothetical protein PF005_g15953 [Phytophthora fragariae]
MAAFSASGAAIILAVASLSATWCPTFSSAIIFLCWSSIVSGGCTTCPRGQRPCRHLSQLSQAPHRPFPLRLQFHKRARTSRRRAQ